MLTQERLKKLLVYDPDTGLWIWNKRMGSRAMRGDPAGHVAQDGYRKIKINGKQFKSSRLAYLYMKGYFPKEEVDHGNRTRDDDRWCNLKEASPSGNSRNRSLRHNNTTGISGINTTPEGTFRTKIAGTYIGTFKNKDDAVKARLKAEVQLDWPNCQSTSPAYNYLKERNLI